MRYFIPNWTGDFRLEQTPEGCTLTVENPSPGDRALLQPFLDDARKRGWIGEEAGIGDTLTTINIPHAMTKVAPVMAKFLTEPTKSWTAIRYVGGKVEVVDGTGRKGWWESAKEAAIEAVATITKPNLGCPEPVARNRRASAVLRAFSTASQWRDFEAQGYLNAVGCDTGRLYRVWHEDEAARRGHRRSLTTESGEPICAWNQSVPAEEQALSLKFAVEHREAWLLHIDDRRTPLAVEGDMRRFA